MTTSLEEKLQFELKGCSAEPFDEPRPIFILGAPRTGSTFFYQMLVAAFRLAYFSNVVNEYFAESPLVGLWLQSSGATRPAIRFHSAYGKSSGLFQPSEASAIMRHWFGGGHPSQSVSTRILPGREQHMLDMLSAAERLAGKPIVIKNAWNCFRIEYLSETIPGATFIWIRRDIRAAACSDLAARYAVHGNPNAWNSATPSRLEELKKRTYVEQVLENQYEFNCAIEQGLNSLPSGRRGSIWYEDLCRAPIPELEKLASSLPVLGQMEAFDFAVSAEKDSSSRLSEADQDGIENYANESKERFGDMFYRCRE